VGSMCVCGREGVSVCECGCLGGALCCPTEKTPPPVLLEDECYIKRSRYAASISLEEELSDWPLWLDPHLVGVVTAA